MMHPSYTAFLILPLLLVGANNVSSAGALDDADTPIITNIIQGKVATKKEFPFMAQILYNYGSGYQFKCGGSLINKQYVVTAGHCVTDPNRVFLPIKDHRVSVGKVTVTTPDQTDDMISLKSITTFGYKTDKKFDIALIKLAKPVPESVATPIKLFPYKISDDIPVEVAGFGATWYGSGTPSPVLLKTKVDISSSTNCSYYNSNWANNSGPQICQESYSGNDSCQGDSGGPLVSKIDGINYLVGATNNGLNKDPNATILCGENTIAYYARMAYFAPKLAKAMNVTVLSLIS